MPELPDILLYVHRLADLLVGQQLTGARVLSPFLVRSVDPPLDAAVGRSVSGIHRLGKRVVLSFGDIHLIFHLMIAGRFRWLRPGAAPPRKIGLAAFEFPTGVLAVTEAGSRKRASLHVVRGAKALAAHDPGGLEVFDADLQAFRAALTRENHTLKRALTDPRLFSGIGNAYSDEILHAARISPVQLTKHLSEAEISRLYDAVRRTLQHWIGVLEARFRKRFPGPGDITAFRPDFAVHGRFGKPCPECKSPVQRIQYAENETNYCARCQTGGRILADRSLSRLLKNDWPGSIDELESGPS
ncbi:MAG: formamidopyrimidine-DNA glycosylase [Planctomycetota bacterium]|nr:formamidopyrimidine-DNA glycosylase [Planctomycetota bacterium]